MLLPILGIFLGIFLGIIFGKAIPLLAAQYLSVIAIAALDTLLEGIKCHLADEPRGFRLIYNFLAAALLSCLLVFFGSQAGLDIYMVAVIAMGIRIYQNLHKIVFLLPDYRNVKKFISAGSHFPED